MDLLRIATAGAVDDGKSTLIGRLLYDTENILSDQYQAVEETSKKLKREDVDLSLITDGLKAEREQGITIDVAYRSFSTARRRFLLADSPGHEQYTRNMATAASTSNVALILLDASRGLQEQTKRHSFISSLLGVKHFAIVINKMDKVDFSEEIFLRLTQEYQAFAKKLNPVDLRFFPISALHGDNILEKSAKTPWYQGESLLSYLENVYVAGDGNAVDFRMPVQFVTRKREQRFYLGQALSGRLNVGDKIIVLPSMKKTSVSALSSLSKPVETGRAGMSLELQTSDEVDIQRGDMIVPLGNQPRNERNLEALLFWMDEKPLDTAARYYLRHTTREVKSEIKNLKYQIDINTLSRKGPEPLKLNQIGRVSIETFSPICFDSYSRNRWTGSFILIDEETQQTAAAGLILDHRSKSIKKATNVRFEEGFVSTEKRIQKTGHAGLTVWLSGLPASGKSTIAKEVEKELFEKYSTFSLDGDNLRTGLNQNLGFSKDDRRENLRRAAEVAKLFNQAGTIVLCSFITPLESDREEIRKIIGPNQLLEVFVDTPLEICKKRDPKGLYAKALAGEIAEFTGVNAPFEKPENSDLVINTDETSLDELKKKLVAAIEKHLEKSRV